MSLSSQQYANLTAHAYGVEVDGKKGQMQHFVGKEITFEGVTYTVREYMNRPSSGYQGAIYQRVDTGEIVVAHRGTEFDRELIKDGVIADGGMVAARTNAQAADAIELTQHALQWAEKSTKFYGRTPQVTVTGHSLGGCLAQITAYRFGLYGETFNAYGAVSLGYGLPEGGSQLINHVKASDVVSAGSHHFGQVRMYASAEDVRVVGALGGYDNDRNLLDVRSPGLALAGGLAKSHNMHHFTNVDGDGKPDRSILADPNAQRLAEHYRPMFDKYRNDIYLARGTISVASSAAIETHAKAQEMAGQVTGQTLQTSAHTVRMATGLSANTSRTATHVAGATVAVGVHHAGSTLASAREAAGVLEAGIDHLQGRARQQGATFGADLLRSAGRLLPDGAKQWVDTQADRVQQTGDEAYRRNLAEAAAARRESHEDAAALRSATQAVESTALHAAARVGDLQHDAIAGAGQQVGGTLATAGHIAEAVARRVTPQSPGEAVAFAPAPQAQAPTAPPDDAVRQIAILQTGLIQLGYHHRVSQPLQINGQFDNATQQAVTAFQAQRNLPITRTFDLATQQALQEQQRVTQQEQQAQQAREQQQRQWQIEQDQRLQREQQARREEEDKAREQARDKELQPEARRPFSDPQHPEHALYADLKQRLEAQGHPLPEDRLNQITGALHEQRFKPDWQGAVGVVNDMVYVRDSTKVYARWDTSLQEPAPSIQDTMHAVQKYDQHFALQQQQTPQPDGPTRSR